MVEVLVLCNYDHVRCPFTSQDVVGCVLHCLTAEGGHGRDLERVRVGGAHGLLLVLRGYFNCLTDKWQLLAGDHVMILH